jgi:hypothetical protein
MKLAIAMCFVLAASFEFRADDSEQERPLIQTKVSFAPGQPIGGISYVSGLGAYQVRQGFSILSAKLQVVPTNGGRVYTAPAAIKDGDWSAYVRELPAGSYTACVIMQIQDDVTGAKIDWGSPTAFEVKVH